MAFVRPILRRVAVCHSVEEPVQLLARNVFSVARLSQSVSLPFARHASVAAACSAIQLKPDPQAIYQAGLRNTVFTNECTISNESQIDSLTINL